MKTFKIAALCLTSAFFASNSFAGVILTNNLTTFQSSGTVNVVSDFEEFSSTSFGFPSDPFLQGGVSYSSSNNLTINNGTGYTANGTNMLTNNNWNPLEGTFYENFNLFGFDAGWSSRDDNGTTITIGTNLNMYVFNVDLDIASSADFYGFIADDNEYFTSFNITSNYNNALNAIDNVTVGVTSVPVSEPTVVALLGLGLVGLGLSRRKKMFN